MIPTASSTTRRRTLTRLIILLSISLGIRILAFNKEIVESVYATGIYPFVSGFLRLFFGWLPFSAGDVLYAVVIFALIIKIIRRRKRIFLFKAYPTLFKNNGLRWLSQLLIIYILFNLLWGLNYNRRGIQYQLGFVSEKYSREDLQQVNRLLLEKVNECRIAVAIQNNDFPSGDSLFNQATAIYRQAAAFYPFLHYNTSSVKKSNYAIVGNYLGFSGYYNPLTGEAQVNTSIPLLLQPFVSCHEIAHQLGYAKENEANFVGYLVATGFGDSTFKYSAYLDLFLYANRNLYIADSVEAKSIRSQLHPLVKGDIEQIRNFYAAYENPIEPLIRWAYGKYLQANDQPSGMMSYNEAVADLIGYYKKYNSIDGGKR